jgi:tetratricopeptide (TPR) repeat protein
VSAALRFDAGLGDAYWVRAMVKLRMGAVKDALTDLAKALKLNPARIEAYATMGDCYEQLRRMDDAIKSYRTALERDPKHGVWWYRVAMLHADMGERSQAEPAVKRAIELGDEADPVPYWLPDAYRVAGEITDGRGDKGSAIRFYKRYLDIAPATAIDRRQIEKRLGEWGVQLREDL